MVAYHWWASLREAKLSPFIQISSRVCEPDGNLTVAGGPGATHAHNKVRVIPSRLHDVSTMPSAGRARATVIAAENGTCMGVRRSCARVLPWPPAQQAHS